MQSETIPAYQLANDQLNPVRIRKQKGQNFSAHATAWERSWSALCGHGKAEPVVDESYALIGHIGWFSRDRIYAQLEFAEIDYNGDGHVDAHRTINEMIELQGDVRVAATAVRKAKDQYGCVATYHDNVHPNPWTLHRWIDSGIPQGQYFLLTDPEGKVLLQLDRRTQWEGTDPIFDPLALLDLTKLAIGVGGMVGKMLIRKIGGRALSAIRSPIVMRGRSFGGASVRDEGMDDVLRGLDKQVADMFGPKKPSSIAGAAGRKTLPGMGVPRPPRPTVDGRDIPVPRDTPEGFELTADEMILFLKDKLRTHRELALLLTARTLSGAAKRKRIGQALGEWAKRTGKRTRVVGNGNVQKIAGTGNYSSMQGNELLIESHVVENLSRYYTEMVHELVVDALARKAIFVVVMKNGVRQGHLPLRASGILEACIEHKGDFAFLLDLLKP